SGGVIERMSFDAWGKRRESGFVPPPGGPGWAPETGWVPILDPAGFEALTTTRGYTGHEQLDPVGLVHMNGRVYDPEIGRFLSADPLIQFPFNLQSLNRYTYVLNNPLSLIDPTGFYYDEAPTTDCDSCGSSDDAEDSFANATGGAGSGGTSGGSDNYGQGDTGQPGGSCTACGNHDTGSENTGFGTPQQNTDTALGQGNTQTGDPAPSSGLLSGLWDVVNPIGAAQAQTAVPMPMGPPVAHPMVVPGTPENRAATAPIATWVEQKAREAWVLSSTGLSLLLMKSLMTDQAGEAAREAKGDRQYLYHYTNEQGMLGIIEDQAINPSLWYAGTKDVRYGDGQYLSDVVPGAMSPVQLSNLFLGFPFQARRFTHYVGIDATGLGAVQGRPGVYVIQNTEPLDITGRVIGFGEVPVP
ncbi:MAG: hypothetical protein GY788_12435, partial [bacterium]|nr:hypothetical protein [bacterium]